MGIFGEKYSKEKFEEATKDHKDAYRTARYIGSGPFDGEGGFRSHSQNFYDRLWDAEEKARNRVEKIYGKGQKEAIALNEKYDCLRANAQNAIKALDEFEKDKLGMKESTEDLVEEDKE